MLVDYQDYLLVWGMRVGLFWTIHGLSPDFNSQIYFC